MLATSRLKFITVAANYIIMAESSTPKRMVKTAETMFGVIERLYESDASVTEVADALNIARSTAYDHLATLEEMGYVVREEEQYRLGLGFLRLGMKSKERLILPDIARPVIERLAKETEEIVRLFVKESNMTIIVEWEQGNRGVVTGGKVGTTLPFHWTAAGKAIMAHLSQREIEAIVDEKGLSGRTENTITELDELNTEIEEIRETGVAFNNEESIKGLLAVGCPIVVEDTVYGAISIGVPANRLDGRGFEEELIADLKGATNEIELKLAYL